MILSNQVNTGKQQVVNNLEISVVSLFEHENIDNRFYFLLILKQQCHVWDMENVLYTPKRHGICCNLKMKILTLKSVF